MDGEYSQLRADLRKQYDSIFQLKDPNGVEIYPVFNVLPIKKDYPDYYSVIKNPISLNTMKKRLPHYVDAQEFINDVCQIPWNAKTYNSEDSAIYGFATILENFLKLKAIPELQTVYRHVRYPNLGGLPMDGSNINNSGLTGLKTEREYTMQQQINGGPTPPVNMATHSLANNANSSMQSGLQNIQPAAPQQIPIVNGISINNNISMSNNGRINMSNNNPVTNQMHPGQEIRSRISPQPVIPPRSMSSTPATHSPSTGLKPSIQQRLQTRRGRPPIIDLPYLLRIKNIMKMLKREVDENNRNLTSTFDKLPDETTNPGYYQMISHPVCLDDIRRRVKTRKYKDFESFQNDFIIMFENYKRYYASNPLYLKAAGLLEYHFRKLVEIELSKPDSDFLPEGELRYPMESVEMRGSIYQIGDWVLLNNANDPNKPVVAQIFKLWYTSDGTRWLNACWYFRPEQTVHRVDRLFYKNEVVKTGQYRDHLISDLVGKCYVVHFTRYQRGNPAIPYEGPLFICEFRYNESDKAFNKIRTWKACLPEELRDQDEDTIPVNGRKFFKYPSPIRHLLPPNATPHDPIPEPTEGDPTAPPLIGAVYLRPKVKRDDLGEYSTSDDCPRYIIRPTDPPEKGVIDEVHGTIITNMQTANALPRTSQSSTRLPTLKQTKPNVGMSSPHMAMKQVPYQKPSMPITQTKPIMPNRAMAPSSTNNSMNNHKIQKPNSIQNLRQPVHNYTQMNSSALNGVVSDLSNQAAKGGMRYITIDVPHSYVLPLPFNFSSEPVAVADVGNRTRRIAENPNISTNNIIWYRGPGISVRERYIDSGKLGAGAPLNILDSPDMGDLDYEEIEEEIINQPSNTKVENENGTQTGTLVEDLSKQSLNGENEIVDEDLSYGRQATEKSIEAINIGLRPSAKFIIHKHKYSTIENII
ncbi:Chromatin structure-remodeling complex subunit RSC1 [Nakaseomyces bracarensis]|uniref:Chromatin structure-remodeling complex subunit RSC1 n=1 Tax=Nakaseomyces bracarensis TaxID=273131 RepID=A0ABR4NNG0_9SACH